MEVDSAGSVCDSARSTIRDSTGLVLITHWRRTLDSQTDRAHLPFWGEWLLYCTMPLFHLHTFIFLSFLLLWWFLFGNPNWRGHLIRLVASSLIPATFFVYCITGLGKTNALAWEPGWTAAAEAHEHWQRLWWFRQLPDGLRECRPSGCSILVPCFH